MPTNAFAKYCQSWKLTELAIFQIWNVQIWIYASLGKQALSRNGISQDLKQGRSRKKKKKWGNLDSNPGPLGVCTLCRPLRCSCVSDTRGLLASLEHLSKCSSLEPWMLTMVPATQTGTTAETAAAKGRRGCSYRMRAYMARPRAL